MKKIIICTYENYSHNLQIKSVITSLLKHDFKIYIFGNFEFKNLYEDLDVEFIPYTLNKIDFNIKDEANKLFNDFSPNSLISYTTNITLSMIKSEIKIAESFYNITKKINPDYILRDACAIYGRILANKFNITLYGYICNICITKDFIFNDILKNLSDCWGLNLSMYSEKECFDIYNKIESNIADYCHKTGITPVPVLYTLDPDEEINLIFSSNSLQPNLNSKRYKIINYKFNNASDYNLIKENLVYISTGTIMKPDLKFYTNLINRIKNSKFNFLISSKPLYEKVKSGELILPKNIKVESYVNQYEILSKSKLFITHGGYNSICESIFFNTPMVVIPFQADQFINATLVNYFKIGFDARKAIFLRPDWNDIISFSIDNKILLENIFKMKNSFLSTQDFEDIWEVLFC